MAEEQKKDNTKQLPDSVVYFIENVIKKIRYRKKVRQDVQAELMSHFEDELQECKTEQERLEKANGLIKEFGDIKLLATLIRRAKKRCRSLWQKILVRTAQVIGIIFLYIFICTIPLMMGKPAIKIDYVQWINEKEQAGRDESENAGVYYEKAANLAESKPEWMINKMAQWPSDYNDIELKKLSDWLEKNKEVLAILRESAKRPYYWRDYQLSPGKVVDLTASLMPDVMEPLAGYRKAAFVLQENVKYEALKGNANQAIDDCFVLMKMGINIEGNGFLIEQLVGISLEALAINQSMELLDRVELSDDDLKGIQEKLENLYADDKPAISFDSEKVFWYDILQRYFTDDGNGDGRPIRGGVVYTYSSRWSPLRILLFDYPSRKEVKTSVEQFFDKSVQLATKTPMDLYNENIDANNWANDTYGTLMLNLEEPAFYRVSQLNWNIKTQRRALLTVLALLQYKEKNGNLPNDLNELVESGYLKEIPMDPYSNKPLVYIKKDKDTFTLYSVGENLKDDGGQPGKDINGRVRTTNFNNGDWIFWPLIKPEK
jgi:hypothetical protein